MEEKVVKMNFFKKVWYSITKFEQYPAMATEGLKRALKYLIILVVLISLPMTLCSVHEMKLNVSEAAKYIQDNIPEFTYSNGNLSVQAEDAIVIEDAEKTGMDKILINTLINTDEEKEQIKKDNSKKGIVLFFFNDVMTLKIQDEDNETVEQKYKYSDIINSFTGTNIEQFAKTDFIQYINSGEMATFYNTYSLSMYVYFLIENFMVALIYSLEIALLGWITTIMLRIKMRFKAIFNMSAYAITLATILTTAYMVANYMTGFTISDIQVAYIAISYIYLAAAIFILKDDFIRKMQEVEKIKQEQIKVREEIQEENDKKEDKNDEKEDKKEDDEGEQPQGSEV